MKLSITTLALSLLAASAAAQVSPISPRINPLAGLPSMLPSPTVGPISRPNIGLPAPLLTPTISLVLSAPAAAVAAPLAPSAVAAGAISAVLPNPIAKLPTYDVVARRENVRHPMSAIMPGLTIRLAANDNHPRTPAQKQQEKDDLDNLFDRGTPSSSVIPAERRDAVGDSRRISLPEWDLERELGL